MIRRRAERREDAQKLLARAQRKESNAAARKLQQLNADRIKHYDHNVLRSDGWVNVLTGQGIQGYDKRTGGFATYGITLYEMDAEYLYASDAFAARIVDLVPHECLREWIEWDKENRDVDDEFARLDAKAKIEEAWQFARCYGGGVLFLNDGTPPDQLEKPLDLNNLKKLLSLTPFTRWEMYIMFEDLDRDITSPMFMKPLYYRLMPRVVLPAMTKTTSPIFARIHHSRIIRFDGKKLMRLLTIRNQYWSDSVFTSLINELRDFGISFGGVANLIQDFRLVIHKIKDLANLLAMPGGNEDLKARINAMGLARSILGTYAIDSEEDMKMESATVTGLPELLDKIMRRLAAACDIPHTRLFNESPSGLAATGQTEQRDWYDHVKAIQGMYLAPRLDRLLKVIYAQKEGPTGGKQPEENKYSFKPLWQLDEKDRAQAELWDAQKYEIYAGLGVVESDQIIEREVPEEASEGELRRRNTQEPGQTTQSLGKETIPPAQGPHP